MTTKHTWSMRNARAWLSAAALVAGGSAGFAAGVNDLFDIFIGALQTDRDALAMSDQAKVDAAVAILQAAPEEPQTVTKSVAALTKALKKLGAVAANSEVAPDVTAVMNSTYLAVVGRAVQSGAAASGYYAERPLTVGNALKLNRLVVQITGLNTKCQNAHDGTKSALKKLAVYNGASKKFDAIIRRYGS